MSDLLYTSDAYVPDRLIAGELKLVTRDVVLTDLGSTGALVRGTVLGMIAADGRYGIALSAAVDGSEVARAILVKDADPSGGDVPASIYEMGQFNEARLTIGAGHTADSIREDLRAVAIYLKSPVAAV